MASRTTRRTHVIACALATAILAAGCVEDGGEPGGTTTIAGTAAPTTATSTASSTTAPPPGTVTVQVFFLDQDAFNEARPPYAVPVPRAVDEQAPARGALDALFAGPDAGERAGGLVLVASGATGVDEVTVVDGTAHVHLAGGCASGGSTFSVADLIVPTLLQFPTVRAIKIYDPDGTTEEPDEPGNSIPECLEP